MPDNASRRGAVDMGVPLMILAFFIIGGFMFWLSGQADNERALRIDENAAAIAAEEEARAAASATPTVAPEDLQMDATPFEGDEVSLDALTVASLLGTQGFWLEMPNGNPFLVSMSADVMAEGLSVGMGSMATVTGVVLAMNDSILTAWTDAGTIGETDRIVAEFAAHFIEASDVAVTAGAGGAAGGGN